LALLPVNNVWINLIFKKIIPIIGVGVALAGFLDEVSVKLKLYDRPKNDVKNKVVDNGPIMIEMNAL
jgi:hypothetical protein